MLRKGGVGCLEVRTGMDWREDSVRGDVREEMGVGLYMCGGIWVTAMAMIGTLNERKPSIGF